ncbi:unnamed protein product [Aphanomyces euteiches]
MARRPIEFAEFLNVLTVIRSQRKNNLVQRYRLGCVLTLQWHLIGRVDDMMKLQHNNFSFNPVHHFTLVCQMRWSKNILEERESPHQILLGSMDERLCCLLNLAVYIELLGCHENSSVNSSEFTFGNGVDGDRMIRLMLQSALDDHNFKKQVSGNLGTHSIRKGPATYCSRNGMTRENVESRGRWKSHKKQVDTYIDIDRPVPDAMVASCLCGPCGPIMYKMDNQDWCCDSFLCDKIAPHIARLMSRQIAVVLSKPLIYAAIQGVAQLDEKFVLMPDKLRNNILREIRIATGVHQTDEIAQIVQRVPIAVSGFGGELNIVELGVDGVANERNSTSVAIMSELAAINSVVLSLKRRQEDVFGLLQSDIGELRHHVDSKLNTLSSVVKRVAIIPRARYNICPEPTPIPPTTPQMSKLSKHPSDLYELWREFEFGLGGGKPANDFTSKERGACKWIYSFRLNFWSLVKVMIQRGHSSDTAVDAIYLAYERSNSVTAILNSLRKDKVRGNYRNLLA